MNIPEVAGKPYPGRLRKQVQQECDNWHIPMPSDAQIGAVLHGLADHTALIAATQYDRLEHFPGNSNEGRESKFWPTELSVGRFLQRTADALGARV